ncbi:transglutaminase-like domain-containing protein [Okibacterium fritillariae]|uniref:Transglutaminase-like superfamily protein n=1 Tax=Okibacterium fritillariae TaxID=123320 RepID=A0A1T5KG17_9MICO|nr:transglutaminase-like domain-containing protein [Okibacterium fritillariae]SKC62328.1 Transglutaminase-like superfamily protein [Okibacterium fritillariae]
MSRLDSQKGAPGQAPAAGGRSRWTPRSTRRAPDGRPGWTRLLLGVLAPLLATAVALAAFWPVYQSIEFVRMAAVTVVVAGALAVLGARFRWSPLLVAALTAAVVLIAGVPLAIPSEATAGGWLPTGPALVHLLEATALSWRQLVTIVTPVGAYQALLVPAFLLGLVTAVLSASLALRSRHPRLALVPPFLLLAAAVALGPTEVAPAWTIAVGALLVLVSAVWAVLLPAGPTTSELPGSRRSRQHADRAAATPLIGHSVSRSRSLRLAITRVAAIAVVLAVALAGSTVLATTLAPASDRDVIRAHVEQPFVPRDYPSPLAGFRSYLDPATRDETLLTVEGLPADARLRLATVDTYTGVVYAVGDASAGAGNASGSGNASRSGNASGSGTDADGEDGSSSSADAAGSASASGSGVFTRVPYRLTPTATGTRVDLTVRVDRFSDVWVPDAGALEQLRFLGPRADALTDSFSYNAATGTAAVSAGLRPGDSYRLTAILPPATDDVDVASLRPGTAPLPEPAAVPDALTEWLTRNAAAPASSDEPAAPGGSLQRALDALASTGYVSHGIDPDTPRSVSGHGIARLETLFTEQPMVGDQEQYATAAALIARQLGFPARVVLGFRPDGAAAGDTSGPVAVTGADIDAWVEIQDSSGRWVTIDPTPAVRDIPERAPDEPTPISKPQTVVPPPVVEDPEESTPAAPDSEVSDPPAEQPWWLAAVRIVLTVAGWTLLIAAILAAPFLAVIAAKARRRRTRRRRGSADARIRAGWLEARDTAVDYGIDIPASATRREAAARIGSKTAVTLASVADRVSFSPDRPDDDDADKVWQGVDELRRRVAERHTRRERLRARIALTSLRRPR